VDIEKGHTFAKKFDWENLNRKYNSSNTFCVSVEIGFGGFKIP
jgi:hypothetical protein